MAVKNAQLNINAEATVDVKFALIPFPTHWETSLANFVSQPEFDAIVTELGRLAAADSNQEQEMFDALAYLINTIGQLTDKLSWLLKIGPFYYAPAIDTFVNHQLTWWYPWVLVGAGLVLGIVGLVVFNKRDLPSV